jgi:hypothetical protein
LATLNEENVGVNETAWKDRPTSEWWVEKKPRSQNNSNTNVSMTPADSGRPADGFREMMCLFSQSDGLREFVGEKYLGQPGVVKWWMVFTHKLSPFPTFRGKLTTDEAMRPRWSYFKIVYSRVGLVICVALRERNSRR